MAEGDDTGLKRCSKCEQQKPKSEFHKNRSSKDGLCHLCKPCNCAHVKAHREADPDAEKRRKQRAFQKHRDKRLQHMREYRLANIDAIREKERIRSRLRTPEQTRVWYMNRREKAIASAARWANENKDRRSEIARDWRQRNKADVNRWDAARRATEKNATPAWANEFFIAEAYHLAKLREQVCGGKWHVDHIVPLQSKIVCGLHVEANLRVIPDTENMRKGNRHWPDMP